MGWRAATRWPFRPIRTGWVAAATTGLPERAEAGRNYDYRYVRFRDRCVAGQADAACVRPDSSTTRCGSRPPGSTRTARGSHPPAR
ncbi:hypothetical protein GCM10010505_55080 [Kitasatospora aburaviensis]